MSECDCGPWVKLSMCGIGSFNGKTGELESVQCPSPVLHDYGPAGRREDRRPLRHHGHAVTVAVSVDRGPGCE